MGATRRHRPLSPQGRLLRRVVAGRLLRQVIACCAIAIVAVFLLDRLASGPVGDYLADAAEWQVYQPESAEEERELQALLESRPGAVWDVQTNPVDHTIWVRDLTLYHFVKVAWLPTVLCLLFVVVLLLVLAAFRRMYALVDALTDAVAGLVADEGRPVELPSELSIARWELEGIRKESLARRAAAETSRQRSQELMAYLVHDVRTPLTTVIGHLSLLEEDPALAPEAREGVAVALRRAEEMEALTGDLFDMTRLALDPSSVSRRPVDLRLLALQVAEELRGGATGGGDSAGSAQTDPPAGSVVVLGDPDLLAKAMDHLLQSALALRDAPGGVEVRGGSARGTALVVVHVPLEGYPAGHARTLVEHAFEPYYRTGSSSGVSLAFTREIARAHGGDVLAWARDASLELVLALPAFEGHAG